MAMLALFHFVKHKKMASPSTSLHTKPSTSSVFSNNNDGLDYLL